MPGPEGSIALGVPIGGTNRPSVEGKTLAGGHETAFGLRVQRPPPRATSLQPDGSRRTVSGDV